MIPQKNAMIDQKIIVKIRNDTMIAYKCGMKYNGVIILSLIELPLIKSTDLKALNIVSEQKIKFTKNNLIDTFL
jgi:hypothetical protein